MQMMGGKIKMSETRGFKGTGKKADAAGELSEEGTGNAKTKEIGSALLDTGKAFAAGGMSDEEKGDTAYEGGKKIVTAIVPVVGGLMELGDKIGKPIKNKLEKADSQGQVNEKKAKRGFIAGTLLNPAKTLSRTMFDKEKSGGEKALTFFTGGISQVFKGDDYVQKLEKNNQKALGIYKERQTIASNQPSTASQKSIGNLKRFNLGRMNDKLNQI
jgi:hypothetical protein